MERLYPPTAAAASVSVPVSPTTTTTTPTMNTAPLGKTVAVVGATGRTGSLMVGMLLARGQRVRALVRSMDKAKRMLPTTNPMLTLVPGTLHDLQALRTLLIVDNVPVDAVAVTSGSLAPLGIFNQDNSPYNVDYLGMQHILEILSSRPPSSFNAQRGIDSFVLLVSTVGVERAAFRFVSFLLDVFGGEVMRWKRAGEELLKQSGLSYAIVRPALLKSSTSISSMTEDAFSEPLVLDYGDRIDGQIERRDLALLSTHIILAELGIETITPTSPTSSASNTSAMGNRVLIPRRSCFEVIASTAATPSCAPSRNPMDLLRAILPDSPRQSTSPQL